MADNGRSAFSSGASSSITGNMLTTSGSTIRQDWEMLAELGRDTTPDWENRGRGCGEKRSQT
jgi:biotin synthase